MIEINDIITSNMGLNNIGVESVLYGDTAAPSDTKNWNIPCAITFRPYIEP